MVSLKQLISSTTRYNALFIPLVGGGAIAFSISMCLGFSFRRSLLMFTPIPVSIPLMLVQGWRDLDEDIAKAGGYERLEESLNTAMAQLKTYKEFIEYQANQSGAIYSDSQKLLAQYQAIANEQTGGTNGIT